MAKGRQNDIIILQSGDRQMMPPKLGVAMLNSLSLFINQSFMLTRSYLPRLSISNLRF